MVLFRPSYRRLCSFIESAGEEAILTLFPAIIYLIPTGRIKSTPDFILWPISAIFP